MLCAYFLQIKVNLILLLAIQSLLIAGVYVALH